MKSVEHLVVWGERNTYTGDRLWRGACPAGCT